MPGGRLLSGGRPVSRPPIRPGDQAPPAPLDSPPNGPGRPPALGMGHMFGSGGTNGQLSVKGIGHAVSMVQEGDEPDEEEEDDSEEFAEGKFTADMI